MENNLQNSVARVLGSKDTEAPAGTAFLFATADEQQYWMTCHHVVRTLPSVKLAVYANDMLTPIDCDYCPELSSPGADVAVLKTKLDSDASSSLGLLVLPFGDPSGSNDYNQWSLIGCGMQMKIGHFLRGAPFRGTFSAQYDGFHVQADDDKMTREIKALGNPWNIPFAARTTKVYEFFDETCRLEPGFSGSPVCIAPKSAYKVPMCVGMLNARRVEGGSKHGYVIPFDVIDAACPRMLPFHRFASCVVVVLAAKRDELEMLCSELNEEVLNRLPHYHNSSRDEWQPFRGTDPTVRRLLDGVARELPPLQLQLASDFLDRGDESFLQYLGGRHLGPLVYVVDPCSTNVEAIREVAGHASDHSRGAHYIYALCGTIGASTRDRLKSKLKQYLGGQFWEYPHSKRLEPAEDIYAFRNRVRESVRQACAQFLSENPEEGQRGGTPYPYAPWSGSRHDS